MIQLISCYFNYYDNPVRKNNYIKFRKHLNADIQTVEVALDKNAFFIDDSIKIIANDQNILWQKERCFNIILENLPSNVDKIVWLDTDIIFHNSNWLKDIEKKLDEIPYVQAFDIVIENHYAYNPCLNCLGHGRALHDYIYYDSKIPKDLAIGLAWGVHRNLLDQGFFDKHILGSNDLLQTIAVIGDIFNVSLLENKSKTLVNSFLDYYKNLNLENGYNIGYIHGTLEHLYHGKTLNRGYNERAEILKDYNTNDLEIDTNGLYKLNDEELYRAVQEYMTKRNDYTTR
jgi:hypothetical protein